MKGEGGGGSAANGRSLRGNVDRNCSSLVDVAKDLECRSLRGNVDRNNAETGYITGG